MKYIDADLLIRKIKGQIRLEKLNFAALGGGGQTFCINTLEWVLKQIDSLQQVQPEVDLEEEVKRWKNKHGVVGMDDLWFKFAHHFFELGQREMRHRIMNPEYNAKVVKQLKSEYPIIKEE